VLAHFGPPDRDAKADEVHVSGTFSIGRFLMIRPLAR
jgi:hypothetical protein